MKIGIMSDVHGNYYALKAVLDHSKKMGVERYIFLGDLIGYLYQPSKVVKAVRDLEATNIQGNHERFLQGVLDGKLSLDWLNKRYGSGHELAFEQLSRRELSWLVNLPKEDVLHVDDLTMKLCHGAPSFPDYYLYPDTDINILKKLCDQNFRFIFTGHSHYPFVFNYKNCSLINVGSVGLSKDSGGMASWGMLDTNSETYVHYRTPYEKEKLISEIHRYNDTNKEYLLELISRNNL